MTNQEIHEETQFHKEQAEHLMAMGYELGSQDTSRAILAVICEHCDIHTLIEVEGVLREHLTLPTYKKESK